jgi:PAS domain S-box-containing protein
VADPLRAPLHRLLQRQLQRVGANPHSPPDLAAWQQLLDRIDRTYQDADADRYTVERSLEISSRELGALHERQRAERDRLEAILGAIRTAVYLVDGEGRVVYANPAGVELLGNPLHGVRLLDVVAGVDVNVEMVRERVLRGECVAEPDGRVRIRGGAPIEVSWTVSTVPGATEKGFVVTLTDLTDQKRVQRDLTGALVEAEVARRSERTRGQFVANMSHELRTPLNGIIGYTELLGEEWGTEPQIRKDLDRVLHSARHLLALINDVLDLSKIDAGRMELHLEEVDLSDLLDHVAASTRTLAERGGNTLVQAWPPDLGTIRSDSMRVRQCLYNLTSNAAKFTRNGTITIRAERRQQVVELSVTDTGIGIAADARARLFQPFTQADTSTTRAYGGTGLGLALTKAFAEMLGGLVLVESEVGRGSTFTLRLPARAELADRPPAPAERWTSGAGSACVLVVDDDPAVFELVARLLARDGVRVVGVQTAEQAMAAVIDERPKAVVLDVRLPGANGWMALNAIRAHPEVRGTPVAVVTTSDDARRTAERLCADAFMSEPIDRARLLETLRAFLRR